MGIDRRAARLLGAFEAVDGKTAGWPLEGFHLGPDLATIRGRLEHEPFAAAIAEERTLTVDQALDEALADALRSPRSDPLTAREREVAALVAAGHTNRQIAAALVIAEPTAERHVATILNKLGFHSRAQIGALLERGRVDQAPEGGLRNGRGLTNKPDVTTDGEHTNTRTTVDCSRSAT